MSLLYHQLELLAPARDADIGIEAVNHGADAVYIGGPGFGARVAASNSVREIEAQARPMKFCRTRPGKQPSQA